MGNELNKEKIEKNKNEAIKKLDNFIEELIENDAERDSKKANLISYWLKEYARYIKSEKTFDPKKQENYKRGDIVKVNLGFNIGNEEGGLHYAIVVNNPDKSSGLVTIIPLTSRKNTTSLHYSEVSLGRSLVTNILSKLRYLADNLEIAVKDSEKIENMDERITERDKLKRTCIELKKYIEETFRMKNDESVALVGNITTISKQRIYTPTIKNKFLKGISISEDQLDLIDNKIIELYTKNK